MRYNVLAASGASMSDERVENLTVHILQGIRQELRDLRGDMNTRLYTLTERVDGLAERMDGLERATISGFEGVHRRLDSLRDVAGDHWRDHEARIRRLETHTGLD